MVTPHWWRDSVCKSSWHWKILERLGRCGSWGSGLVVMEPPGCQGSSEQWRHCQKTASDRQGGRWIEGEGKLSKKLLRVIGSGGCRREGDELPWRSWLWHFVQGDTFSHDNRTLENEQVHWGDTSSALGVLYLRCSWTKWGRCPGGNCTLESGGDSAKDEHLKVSDMLQPWEVMTLSRETVDRVRRKYQTHLSTYLSIASTHSIPSIYPGSSSTQTSIHGPHTPILTIFVYLTRYPNHLPIHLSSYLSSHPISSVHPLLPPIPTIQSTHPTHPSAHTFIHSTHPSHFLIQPWCHLFIHLLAHSFPRPFILPSHPTPHPSIPPSLHATHIPAHHTSLILPFQLFSALFIMLSTSNVWLLADYLLSFLKDFSDITKKCKSSHS